MPAWRYRVRACWQNVTGLLGAAQKDVIPADGVERLGLAGRVGGGAEQSEGLLPVAERVAVTALVLGDPAKGDAGEGLAGAVAELPLQPQTYRQVTAGLPVVAQPETGDGEGPAGRGLPGHVTQPGRGGQRGALEAAHWCQCPRRSRYSVIAQGRI